VCLPSTCDVRGLVCIAGVGLIVKSYGAVGRAVKALLALDSDVGAIRSLELDIKSGYNRPSALRCLVNLSAWYAPHPDLEQCGKSPC